MVKEDHIEMVDIVMKQMNRIMIKMTLDMNVAGDAMIEIATVTENVKIITDTTTIDIIDQRNMNVIIEMKEVIKKPTKFECNEIQN